MRLIASPVGTLFLILLYVAHWVGWGEAKNNLINNQPVLETRSHAEEELRETSKAASYPMNHLSYF